MEFKARRSKDTKGEITKGREEESMGVDFSIKTMKIFCIIFGHDWVGVGDYEARDCGIHLVPPRGRSCLRCEVTEMY